MQWRMNCVIIKNRKTYSKKLNKKMTCITCDVRTTRESWSCGQSQTTERNWQRSTMRNVYHHTSLFILTLKIRGVEINFNIYMFLGVDTNFIFFYPISCHQFRVRLHTKGPPLLLLLLPNPPLLLFLLPNPPPPPPR